MPRRAPVLECSEEDKASLIAISQGRTEEARAVERARIILARLEGKEIQQVARELRISVPTVTKWCKRFSLWGLRGLRDDPRSGKPVRYDAAFRSRVLALLEQRNNRLRPACLTGTDRQWRGTSAPAYMRSGVSCAAKASTCNDIAAGV